MSNPQGEPLFEYRLVADPVFAQWTTASQNIVVKTPVGTEPLSASRQAALSAALKDVAEAIDRSAEAVRRLRAELLEQPAAPADPHVSGESVEVLEPVSHRGEKSPAPVQRESLMRDIESFLDSLVQRMPSSTRHRPEPPPEDATAAHSLVSSSLEQYDPLELSHRMSDTFFQPVDTGEVLIGQAQIRATRMRELERDYGLFSSEQVARLSQSQARNVSQLAHRWQKQRRIFGVKVEAKTRFPGFQFDREGQPRKVIAEVLNALPLSDGWSIAFWFATPHAALPRQQRPVDVLEHHPELAVKAARYTAQRTSDWL